MHFLFPFRTKEITRIQYFSLLKTTDVSATCYLSNYLAERFDIGSVLEL